MIFSRDGSSEFWRMLRSAALLLVAVLVAGPAQAQQPYKQKPAPAAAPTWPKVGLSQESKDVGEMLKGNATLDPVVFDKFFLETLFPHFTRSENFQNFAYRTNLPGMRRACRSYFTTAKSGPVHERLNEKTLQFMDEVAQDNYDPAARANAMMMIADLNETDPGGAPWKKAIPALLKGVTAPTTIDAVRVPALRGLLRHAQATIDGEARGEVLAAMLAVLKDAKPPADRTPEGTEWIRRRAIDVLVAMGEPGADNAVATALAKTVGDETASVGLRSAAAAALANPKLPLPQNSDAGALAKAMGSVAVEAYKSELSQAATQFKAIAADRLKQNLKELRLGLLGDNGKGGAKAIAGTAAQQQLVAALANEIDKLIAACATVPLTQPVVAPSAAIAGTPVIPLNTQEPLAKAIAQAGGNLEALVLRGEAAAPAESAPGPVPGGAAPKKPPVSGGPAAGGAPAG